VSSYFCTGAKESLPETACETRRIKQSHISGPRRSAGVFLLVAFLSFAFGSALAQQDTAEIVGTVTDSSGAVVPAQVIIENVGTGISRTIQAQDGSYTFTLLQIGKYAVHVDAPGFKKEDIPPFDLVAGERRRIDVMMQVGQQSETVRVSALTEAALQTDNSTISQTVSGENIQNLPMNGLNFIVLAQDLTAGANSGIPGQVTSGTRPDDRRASGEISANGQFPSANNFLIDGMDNNERIIGAIGVRPSTEAMAEFRVETSLYSADISRVAGAVTNVITKAGTNTFHGSAYEYIRNDDLDGKNFYSVTQPELRQNQFGGAIGGPVLKNKVFFFFDYQGLRIVNGVTSITQVPTDYEEAHPGDLTDVGGPLITSPNKIALNYFTLYPKCNYNCNPGTTNNFYSYSPRRTQNADTIDTRADYHFSDRDSFFARYTYNKTITDTPGELPPVNGIAPGGEMYDFAGASKEYQHNIQLNLVHVFTPKLLTEFKIGWTRVSNASLPINYGINASTQFGLIGANYDQTTTGLTPMQIAGYGTLGDEAYVPLEDIDNTGQLNFTLTYNRGAHTIRMGTAWIRRLFENVQSAFGIGAFSFNGTNVEALTEFFQGDPTTVTRQNQVFPSQYRTWEPSVFIQDDWHVKKSLTLNLGVRYDVYTPFTERHGRLSNFSLAAGALLIPGQNGVGPTAGVKTDYSNVAPRIGFSYQALPHTVVRGGFGITYLPMGWGTNINEDNQPFTFNYSPLAETVGLSEPLPIPTVGSSANPSGGISGDIAPNYRSTLITQMSLGVEQAFGANVAEIRYVGSIGRHVYRPNVNWDTPLPQTTPFSGPGGYATAAELPLYNVAPLATSVLITDTEGISSYNALQATFTRQLNHGLAVNTNYTWGHDLSDSDEEGGVNDYQVPTMIRQVDYGNDENEIRSRIAGGVTYYLPFGQAGHGFLHTVTGGWQVNALGRWMTGGTFTVLNGDAHINNGVNSSDRPNMIGNPFHNVPAGLFFNPAAFAPQPFGTIGNERVNQLHGPHTRSLDLSGSKSFQLTEKVALLFRAEFFNVTNTPSFAVPGNDINTSGVGLITGTVGTPRQIQGSLKVVF
jgi:Carboxypeptidase regulatory-like domain/TonB dependent receptor